ncbi:MAG: WYL domain-containing protein [Bacteroidales bacterium]|nr:WYL domain-containing protein [Bacteroidales bacterium]
MDEQRKIYRVFQLISRLRAPLGCTKNDVARDFDVTVRTIERNLNMLRDLGFRIEKNGNRFRIAKPETTHLLHEDLIVFSLEEASAIRNALDTSRIESPLRESLLDKLYALTELDEMAKTLRNNSISSNIAEIRKAIKSREQLCLKDYHSVNSNTVSDRLIEPIRFYHYYRYLMAYETESGEIRQFKTDRIGSVKPNGKAWKFEDKHQLQYMDVFGLSGMQPFSITLKLNNRAMRLLIEEFPDASEHIVAQHDGYVYTDLVCSYEGVGRFVMGLADSIEIVEPEGFRIFIHDKLSAAIQRSSK